MGVHRAAVLQCAVTCQESRYRVLQRPCLFAHSVPGACFVSPYSGVRVCFLPVHFAFHPGVWEDIREVSSARCLFPVDVRLRSYPPGDPLLADVLLVWLVFLVFLCG